MMRKRKTSFWFLPAFPLMAALAASGAWAQDSNNSSAAASALSDQPQIAQPPDGSVNWKGVGVGAGTVVTNLVYVPAKLVYGILGGIAGGAGYALTGGNKQVANSIWRSSLGGDYVLTPDMMTGKKPIYFSGANDIPSVQAVAPVTSSSPSAMAPGGQAQSLSATSPTTPPQSLSAAGSTNEIGPATRPIDSGAGPVRATAGSGSVPYAGSTASHRGYNGYNPVPAKRSPVSDTSVE
jgi:hypothetical protein